MWDEILPYYNQELDRVHRLALEFAKKYPRVARHLGINQSQIKDPDLGRITEAFAFLSAHIHYKIEDDFPEIVESFLGVLYPHYLRTIPSFSIVQFKEIPELQTPHYIQKNTIIETTSHYSKSCQFVTTYPVTLWPIEVVSCQLSAKPFKAPTPTMPNIVEQLDAILQLTLRCTSSKLSFSGLSPGSLRFYLDGPSYPVYQLFELILNETLIIAIKSDSNPALFLDKANIRSVGFEVEEKLLPYRASGSQGYDSIAEFFMFPRKFMFFDLQGLTGENLKNSGNTIEILFYLKKSNKELEKKITHHMFKLGCTPIVNLYKHFADPIHISQTETEYLVIPDARMMPLESQVNSVEKVTVYNEQGSELKCFPFYGLTHHASDISSYWYSTQKMGSGDNLSTYISFNNLDFNPDYQGGSVAEVEVLCTDGLLPYHLPFGGNEPFLQVQTKDSLVASVNVLVAFTRPIQPKLRNKIRWKLISHLSLNFFSLIEEGRGIEMLKEILALYNFKDAEENKQMIESIRSVTCKQATARWTQGFRQSCVQGIEIHVALDVSAFVGNALYLFVQVLDNFFARFATFNSFTQLFVTCHDEILYQCSKRAGKDICF